MPKQLVILGRPVPRLSVRRISLILVGLSVFAVVSLIFTLPSSIPAGPSLSKYTDHKLSVPAPVAHLPEKIGAAADRVSGVASSLLTSLRQPAHPPPRQRNDTDGESNWWTDWRWLSVPFSSSLTLDEDRSMLPPLHERPPIYCYYDTTIKKDKKSKEAESELLLIWRRAWWAKGFRPMILGPGEAMNNPLYDKLQRIEMDSSLKIDLMRWLAWENMGGGILSQYTLLPMGAYDDPLLSFFRRGSYPELTMWTDIDSGLFAGPQTLVTAAVKAVMGISDEMLRESKDFLSAAPAGTFQLDSSPKALAYYDATVLENKYGKVAELVTSDRPVGLAALAQLVNAHLLVAWQNVFQDGIAVLKPKPTHTTHLVSDAWELAQSLSLCLDSPLPSSCPPNMPKCSPCDPSRPAGANVALSAPDRFRNASALFAIGTVPHPFTLATLDHLRESLTVPWIRRQLVSDRDPWVRALTAGLLGEKDVAGAARRVLRFKDAVAGDFAVSHALWLTAEKEPPSDLAWRFGFPIPHINQPVATATSDAAAAAAAAAGGDNSTSSTTTTTTPTPPTRQIPQPFRPPLKAPTAADLETERMLWRAAVRAVTSDGKADPETDKVRAAIEAWNLADTEAWKFARAFLARASVEREEWEKEESRYTHGAGVEQGSRSWTRWLI